MPDTEDLDGLLLRLERIVTTFENESDVALRERVFELLESVDAVHRLLVWSVAERVWKERPELFDALLEDRETSILFEMYGLVSPKRREAEAPPPGPTAVFGLSDLEATIPPPLRWHSLGPEAGVAESQLLAQGIEGERVLVTRAAGEIRLYRDACPPTPMPISAGSVRDGAILCPWHDCRFDLATGRRLDREGEGLAALPLTVNGGEIRVGIRAAKRSAA